MIHRLIPAFEYPGIPKLSLYMQYLYHPLASPNTSNLSGIVETETNNAEANAHQNGRACISLTPTAGAAANGRDAGYSNFWQAAASGDCLLACMGFNMSHTDSELSMGWAGYTTTTNWTETAGRVTLRKLTGDSKLVLRCINAAGTLTEAITLSDFPPLKAATWYDIVLLAENRGNSHAKVTVAIGEDAHFNPNNQWVVRTYETNAFPSATARSPIYGYRAGSTSQRVGYLSHFGYATGKRI